MNNGHLPRGVKLAHFNVRSITPKCDSVNLWLEEGKYEIATLNETWLNPDVPSSLLDIGNYDILRQDRATGKRGGGLITLIRKGLNIVYDPDKHKALNVSSLDTEILITELKIGHVKKMIVVNCYRPPSGNVANFFDNLENALDQIRKIDEYELYINRDLNIPYNITDSPEYRKLKMFERKYNLTQLIKTPTRCTAKTRNILDLMLTNCKYISDSGSDDVSISDHQPVWLIRKKRAVKSSYVDFECRCYANYNKIDYQNDLLTQDWDSFYRLTCPNELWDCMSEYIIETAERYIVLINRINIRKSSHPG